MVSEEDVMDGIKDDMQRFGLSQEEDAKTEQQCRRIWRWKINGASG